MRRVLSFVLSCPSLCLVGIVSHTHTHSRLDTYLFLTLSLFLSLFGIYMHLFVFLGFMLVPFHPCGVFVYVPPIGNKYLDYLHIDASYYFLCVHGQVV